jgi:hypothetical protein
MGFSKDNNRAVVLVFIVLGLAFASYDLILLFIGHAHTLLNVSVQDGYRFDESYMYFAGIGKTILFDPHLKEHAQDFTLRPVLPTAIFSGIYWLCGKNLDLAIFFGHVVPPLISCILIYRIAFALTKNQKLAILAVLLAVGHFVFSLLVIAAKIFSQPAGGIGGPDLYLLKQIFVHVGMIGNITAPTQFARLFSPALTLPFLLLPVLLVLQQSRPALRGGVDWLELICLSPSRHCSRNNRVGSLGKKSQTSKDILFYSRRNDCYSFCATDVGSPQRRFLSGHLRPHRTNKRSIFYVVLCTFLRIDQYLYLV